MKTLFESILDIDSIDTDANAISYLSSIDFQELYGSEIKSININKDNPICITGNYESMRGLCEEFKAENININKIYPKTKIRALYRFVSKCKNLINFSGPESHRNYSEIETLDEFFNFDNMLKTFDLTGIARIAKKIQSINHMFNACTSIKNIDLSYFGFTYLTEMEYAFTECMNLERINLGDSNARINAFCSCWNNVKLKEFNAPNMILYGDYIFYNCKSLKNINVKYIDLSKSYYDVFDGCDKLENVNLYGLCHGIGYSDFSWAISLNDKSWDFLFKNLGDGKGKALRLPDIPKKEKLIEKYSSITKKHNFRLI